MPPKKKKTPMQDPMELFAEKWNSERVIATFSVTDEISLVVYDAKPVSVEEGRVMKSRRWAMWTPEGSAGGIVWTRFEDG